MLDYSVVCRVCGALVQGNLPPGFSLHGYLTYKEWEYDTKTKQWTCRHCAAKYGKRESEE